MDRQNRIEDPLIFQDGAHGDKMPCQWKFFQYLSDNRTNKTNISNVYRWIHSNKNIDNIFLGCAPILYLDWVVHSLSMAGQGLLRYAGWTTGVMKKNDPA